MKRNMVILTIAIVLYAGTVLASTLIDTYESPTAGVTNNFTGIGQTFIAPADNVLESFTFGIAPRPEGGNLTFSIFEWFEENPAGTALYSVTMDWPTVTSDILVTGINLVLTKGNLYGAVIDLQGYNLESVHYVEGYPYAGGNGFWTHDMTTWIAVNELDLRFQAEFGANIPDPAPNPPAPEHSPVSILIDIKPGGYPNSINLKSKGSIPVAILTTTEFDAITVDSDTVTFANASPTKSKMTDIDNDGDMDMLLHFDSQDLDIEANDTEATLMGKCNDGTDIAGTDSVSIVPEEGKRKGNHNKHFKGRASNHPAIFVHTSCRNPHIADKACMLRW
jgi:hypothetical protein